MITNSSAVMPMPISEQSQKSKPPGAVPPLPVISADAPPLKVRSSISHSEIGRNAIAAMPPDTIRPWYSARSTLPALLFTAKVPMIEAMMDMPPMTSG